MRRNQPTGAASEEFDELRAMEPIGGEWHSSVIVEPGDGRIPGNAAFQARLPVALASSRAVTGRKNARRPSAA